MKVLRFMFALIALLVAPSFSALAQQAPRLERLVGISSHQKPAAPLLLPQGLRPRTVRSTTYFQLCRQQNQDTSHHTNSGSGDSRHAEPNNGIWLRANVPDRHEFSNLFERKQIIDQQFPQLGEPFHCHLSPIHSHSAASTKLWPVSESSVNSDRTAKPEAGSWSFSG